MLLKHRHLETIPLILDLSDLRHSRCGAEHGIFFERKDIENWAIRRRIQLRNIDDVPSNKKTQTASILDAMTAGGFYYDLEGLTSETLLTNLVTELKLHNIENALLLERVLERENLSSK